jgi:PAS domain S-box-containing protein
MGFSQGPMGILAAVLSALLSAYGLIELVESLGIPVLSLEEWLFPDPSMMGAIPTGRMSPATAAILLLSGAVVPMLVLGGRGGKRHKLFGDLAGCLGILVALIGAVFVLGYLHGAPFLYGTVTIPMAATTALAVLSLGTGQVLAAGPDGYPSRLFAGPSTRARLLRVFVSTGVGVVVAIDLIHAYAHWIFFEDNAYMSGVSTMLFAVISGALIARVALKVADDMDRSEEVRKGAEERMRKGFQLETALLRINTMILEGADIREALETACEAIVEMGYRMCWIGQPDPERIIRPVAYKGFTDGYPENIDVRWDDSSERRGPTEIAVRTGQPCVIQSIRESPIFGPWRESAIGHGYHSMAAFPLKSGEGDVIGVMDVYSDREGAFSDEEAGRLGMFAQQCSIAVMNARRLETLLDVNQRLAFHVSRMPFAYIVWDMGFGVVEWNPAAERIFGWKANEAIGKNAYELIIPKEEWPQFEYGWSKLLKGDESTYSLNSNVRKDGTIITCEWFNALLHDASGNVSRVLSMVHDVTEKAELERQLQTSQRMEAVGTLAGGIAHDFNNSLTGIVGFGELLRMRMA